jgi:NAD(P)-dependent dehydrogenase (short-subunit alcohol dehydrogenase family)
MEVEKADTRAGDRPAESLRGEVAIVTGGGRGIGLAIARSLARAGAQVVVSARSAAQVEEAASLIQAEGGTAFGWSGDVTSNESVAALVDATMDRYGRIDLLVNNAGVGGPFGPLYEVALDEWRECIEIDLLGPVICSKAVLPAMMSQGSGRIINVASAAGLRGRPYAAAYSVAKTGVIRFTECLANEVKEHGISVFVIHPGAVHTSMEDRAAASDAVAKWMPHFIPMVREHGVSAEVPAGLCLALAAGRADFLSGCFLDVGWDLEQMVLLREEILQRDLYTLRVNTVNGLA